MVRLLLFLAALFAGPARAQVFSDPLSGANWAKAPQTETGKVRRLGHDGDLAVLLIRYDPGKIAPHTKSGGERLNIPLSSGTFLGGNKKLLKRYVGSLRISPPGTRVNSGGVLQGKEPSFLFEVQCPPAPDVPATTPDKRAVIPSVNIFKIKTPDSELTPVQEGDCLQLSLRHVKKAFALNRLPPQSAAWYVIRGNARLELAGRGYNLKPGSIVFLSGKTNKLRDLSLIPKGGPITLAEVAAK